MKTIDAKKKNLKSFENADKHKRNTAKENTNSNKHNR